MPEASTGGHSGGHPHTAGLGAIGEGRDGGPSLAGRRAADWPGIIRALLDAGTEGSQALADAGVRAARRLVRADGAAVVRWRDGRAGLVACQGDVIERFERRPAEGSGRLGWRPVAVATVDPRTDLVVIRSTGAGFTDDDVEALQAVASLLGRGPIRTPDVLALIQGLAARLAASLDLDEVLVTLADAVARLLRADIAGVLLVSGDELEMRCAVGNRTVETAHLRIRRGQGLAGRVLATGRPERVDDYATDPRIGKEFLAVAEAEGTCSAVGAPLSRDQRTTGVLCAWRRRRAPFSDDDEALLATLANLAAAAVHQAGRVAGEQAGAEALRRAHDALLERCRAAERDLAVHAELDRIAVDGDDLSAVLRALRGLTGGVALVVDDDGRVLAACDVGAAEELRARIVSQEAGGAPPPGAAPRVVEPDGDGCWVVVSPVRAAGTLFGQLCLQLDAPPVSGEVAAAEHAAVVGGLLLARQEASVSAARRLQSEFVWDLLEGRLPDGTEAFVRARHLGAGFRLPARVAIVEASGLSGRAITRGWSAEQLDLARARLAQGLAGRLEEAGIAGAVLARRGDVVVLVVPRPAGDGPPGARRLGAVLVGAARPEGVVWRVGVGGPVEAVSGFPGGWRQAGLALSAAPSPDTAGVFDDLGVLQFLLAPGSRSDLDGFAERLLGPLVAYDRDHGSELVATLQAYLATDCSTRRAGERLCVHHKTVCYRLQRVEELTALHLDTQDDRFHAHLALKILGLNGDGAAQPPVGTKASK